MGGERVRAWQQVCFCLALLIYFPGCSAIDDLARQRKVREALASGDQLMASGDFEGSLRAFESAAKIARDQEPADTAWYKMGLIHLNPRNPKRDRDQSAGSFNRVLSGFPESPWAEQAMIWVGVLKEVEESSRELAIARETLEASRRETEHMRQALGKSQQEVERSRQEIEKMKQILEKSRQVDIEIEKKRRVRGR